MLLDSLGGLTQSAVTLAGMFLLIARYGWWLPPLLFFAVLPVLAVALRYSTNQHRWWRVRTPDERRARYDHQQLTTIEPAAEIRLYGLGAYFLERFRSVRDRLRSERLRIEGRNAVFELAASAFSLVVLAGVLAWMLDHVSSGRSDPRRPRPRRRRARAVPVHRARRPPERRPHPPEQPLPRQPL